MRRRVRAVLVCSLAIPYEAWAFQVTGSGTVGTVPVWTSTTVLGGTSPIDGIASKNLFITGPTPWIDFTAAGGMGDAQTNTTGSMTSGMSGLTTTSGPAFASGDVGKVVGIAGAGLATATSTGTATGSSGTGGMLTCGATYYYKITYVRENGTSGAFVSESPPTASTSVMIPTLGCTSNDGIVTFSGFSSIPAAGYRVYFASTSGREVLQPLSGMLGSCTPTGGDNACAKTSSYTLNTAALDGPLPPTISVLVTTIHTYTSGTSVSTLDVASQSTSGATVVWGTNNDSTWSTVLGTCNSTGSTSSTGRGCQVFFPGVTGSGSTLTGDYLTLSGFTNQTSGGTNVPGIVLRGGGSGAAGTFSGVLPSAEIVGVSRVALVTIGTTGTNNTTSGFAVENLGFRDPFGTGSGSTAVGELFGGLKLLNCDHFYLGRASLVNSSAGYGIQLDTEPGTTRQTQIGSINDTYCVSCMVGISVPYDASDIDINGGRFEGTIPTTNQTASIGLDLERNNSGTNNTPLGNIRVRGGAIVNFNTGAYVLDCEGCTIIQEKFERIPDANNGTAISIDGTGTTTCFDNQMVSDIIAGFPTGINVLTSNCTRSAILLPAITNVGTGGTFISDNGVNSIELNNLTNTAAKPGLQLSSTGHITTSAANASVAGTCTLNGGAPTSSCSSSTFGYSYSAAVCTASSQQGTAEALLVTNTGSKVTIAGPSGATNMVGWICVGNPNSATRVTETILEVLRCAYLNAIYARRRAVLWAFWLVSA